MTTKQPPRPPDEPIRNLVPAFEAPPADPPTDQELERVAQGLADLPTAEEPQTARPRRFLGLPLPTREPGAAFRENGDPSRTGTFTTGDDGPVEKPSIEDTTALLAACVLLAATLAAVGVKKLLRAQLRKPTKRQARDIGGPIGRIMLRRLDMVRLTPDITDMLLATAAAVGYADEGPLLLPPSSNVNPGVPAGINEEE